MIPSRIRPNGEAGTTTIRCYDPTGAVLLAEGTFRPGDDVEAVTDRIWARCAAAGYDDRNVLIVSYDGASGWPLPPASGRPRGIALGPPEV